MSIVITGATGHLGRLVVEHLLARGTNPTDIVATGRSTERLAALAELGIRTIASDYEDPQSLESAFADADTLVLISGSEVGRRIPQHTNAIRAAEQAGVEHIIYTSAPRATTSALLVAPEHKATEELLAASPIQATVLRNNWYNENYEQAFAQAAATGIYAASTGSGLVASASRSDFAEAAAVVATTGTGRGEVLELAGDTAWNGADFAAAVAEVAGRDVTFADLSPEQHSQALQEAGLDEDTIGFLVTMDASIAAGELDGPSPVLSELIGRPTTPLAQTLAVYAA
jgi:NAD(P)H dehydrogenase (quinone)